MPSEIDRATSDFCCLHFSDMARCPTLSPFSGVKPTWAGRRGMSACDPQRTSERPMALAAAANDRSSATLALPFRSESCAGLHHVGPARQRIGAEASGGKRACDRVIVVERVEQIVHADRPEEVLVGAAQLEIDRRVGGDKPLRVGLIVVHEAFAPGA